MPSKPVGLQRSGVPVLGKKRREWGEKKMKERKKKEEMVGFGRESCPAAQPSRPAAHGREIGTGGGVSGGALGTRGQGDVGSRGVEDRRTWGQVDTRDGERRGCPRAARC